MDVLYTRSGRLLQLLGDHLHSRSGRYLGQLQNNKVYDPDGRYCGTLVGDRVVHRTVDSSGRMTASAEAVCPPITGANRSGMNLWGIEPDFAD
jgi:hypothetical protein